MINQAALKFFRVNFKFLVIINLLILSLFACDGNNDDETQIINNTEELGYYSIQSPDQIFQVDDYINAGWKKSKSFIFLNPINPSSALPPITKSWGHKLFNSNQLRKLKIKLCVFLSKFIWLPIKSSELLLKSIFDSLHNSSSESVICIES